MDLNTYKYKDILIISRGFRDGDAITTLNLFSQWPKENLYCASPISLEYRDRLNEYYRIGNKEVKYKFPFNKISRPSNSGVESSTTAQTPLQSNSGWKRKVYTSSVRPILQYLDMYENRMTVSLSPAFKEWIKTIKPSVIYSSVGEIPIADLLLQIHSEFPDIPIVIHNFDDWTVPPYRIFNNKQHRHKCEELLRSVLSIATLRLTSSQQMADDYTIKYGFPFICFHNPAILPEKFAEKVETSNSIVFTGKIGKHNEKALIGMSKAIESLKYNNISLRFDIYTNTTPSRMPSFFNEVKSFSSTIIHPPVPHKQVPEILRNAKILYLPISTNRQNQQFVKYSMSTKMGEYLASGTPMLYCGPESIAMTEFLKVQKCALIVTQDNEDALKAAIYKIVNSNKSINMEDAFKIAKQYFDMGKITHEFTQKILSVCK